jgi:hypothetical protein
LKNFTHYGTKNTDAVVKSLEKDLTTALEVANGNVTRPIEQLEKPILFSEGRLKAQQK